VETLCQAGIPICTRKGAGGGLSLPERFVLSKSYLSEQEQNEILAGSSQPESGRLSHIRRNPVPLSALFGVRNADWIDVDFSDWSPERKDLFTLLRTAIIEKRPVTFDYFGTNGKKTTRTAEPLRLSLKHRPGI
jgi:predicted DNA-binding transcriptional regulator YafY